MVLNGVEWCWSTGPFPSLIGDYVSWFQQSMQLQWPSTMEYFEIKYIFSAHWKEHCKCLPLFSVCLWAIHGRNHGWKKKNTTPYYTLLSNLRAKWPASQLLGSKNHHWRPTSMANSLSPMRGAKPLLVAAISVGHGIRKTLAISLWDERTNLEGPSRRSMGCHGFLGGFRIQLVIAGL